MDRKAWLVIAACLIGLFWSQYDLQKRNKAWVDHQAAEADKIAKKTPSASTTNPANPAFSSPATSSATSALTSTASKEPALRPTDTRTLRTDLAEYQFSSLGGLETVDLLKHKGLNGKDIYINDPSTIPIGAISENPSNWVLTNGQFLPAISNSVALQSTLPSGLTLTKTFRTGSNVNKELKDDYQIYFELVFQNPGTGKVGHPAFFIHTGSSAPIHEKDIPMYIGFDYQAQAKTIHRNVTTFNSSWLPFGKQATTELRESSPGILWAGTKNQYFTSILQPLGELRGDAIWATRQDAPKFNPDSPQQHSISGALGFPSFSLAPGESKSFPFALYAGPKEFSRLKKLGAEQQGIMEFGFFGFFSSSLLQAMNWLHSFVKNYGIAIILLTLIIKSALWPLQNKAMKSMKKMSLLAPKMTEFKEKYKDDPTRMNQEVMKLYKDYGVNPVGGCLPMLLQMPIFFGFYSMLAVAVELRNSSFLWVNDLSQPDTVFRLLGVPVNVLPLVMALTMLWQMRITPTTGDKLQQRIFLFMPVIFLVICYNYASALALYWTVQNIFSIVQLYLTRNDPLPELVKVNKTNIVNAKPAKAKPAKAKTLNKG